MWKNNVKEKKKKKVLLKLLKFKAAIRVNLREVFGYVKIPH